MNPLIPLEFWIPLMLLLGWALIRSSRNPRRPLGQPWDTLSLLLRAGTLAAMGVLLLNPGEFAPVAETRASTAWVLVDRSASMSTTDAEGRSRFAQAVALADPETENEVELRVATFADQLEIALDADALADQRADGENSDLSGALDDLLKAIRGDPRPCRGIVVLSDGISLSARDNARELGLAARADNIPVSAKLLGEAPWTPDLALRLPQRIYTVTSGANRPLYGRVRSRHLPPLRTRLALVDAQGATVNEVMLDLKENTETPFEIHTGELPQGLHPLSLVLRPAEGEEQLDNNRLELRMHAVEVSLNVLLLEGIPHWDSKFLSQWLRGQHGIRLTTLHRLSDNRWFRVSHGEDEPETETGGTLPGEHQDFRNFDVILVGRGLDYLATSQTTAALHRFVRDHGGVLIFTRGRPVSTPHAGIESLMPVQWLNDSSSDHLAGPAPAGIRAGLFGDLLPGKEDPLWQELPPLRGLHRLRLTDGLTTSLMQAAAGLEDPDPWPVLLSRRVGAGRVLMINGEGMWHWDFRPEMPRQEKWYGQFWTQLLLWVVQSSRFQPGFEYSVEWSEIPADLREPVTFRVQHRLESSMRDRALSLKITSDNGDSRLLPLLPESNLSAAARWMNRSPGFYGVSVVEGNQETPSRYFRVEAPPGEMDDLVPREEPLKEIVEMSGGRWLEDGNLSEAFAAAESQEITADTEAVWHPHWTRGWILLGLIALPAAEWTMRRRRGQV